MTISEDYRKQIDRRLTDIAVQMARLAEMRALSQDLEVTPGLHILGSIEQARSAFAAERRLLLAILEGAENG